MFVQRVVGVLPSKLDDSNLQLLDSLNPGPETLRDITDNFEPKMKHFHVFFFWEQEKSDLGFKWDYVSNQSNLLLGLIDQHGHYVVAETSAAPILDDTDRAGLRAEHRNMRKFATRNSQDTGLSSQLYSATVTKHLLQFRVDGLRQRKSSDLCERTRHKSYTKSTGKCRLNNDCIQESGRKYLIHICRTLAL